MLSLVVGDHRCLVDDKYRVAQAAVAQGWAAGLPGQHVAVYGAMYGGGGSAGHGREYLGGAAGRGEQHGGDAGLGQGLHQGAGKGCLARTGIAVEDEDAVGARNHVGRAEAAQRGGYL